MRTGNLTFFYLALSFAASGVLGQFGLPLTDLGSDGKQSLTTSDTAAQTSPPPPPPVTPTSAQQPPVTPTTHSAPPAVTATTHSTQEAATPPPPSSTTKQAPSTDSSSSSKEEAASSEQSSTSSSTSEQTAATSNTSSATSLSSASTSAPTSSTGSATATTPAPSKTSAGVVGDTYFTSRVSRNTDVPTGTVAIASGPTASAASASSKGFFANKPAVAGTFLAVGVAGILAVYMAMRWFKRRQQDRRWAEEDDFLTYEKGRGRDVEYGATGAMPRAGGAASTMGSGVPSSPASPIDRNVDTADAAMMSQADIQNVMVAAPADAYPSRDVHYGQDAYDGQGHYAQQAAYGAYQPEYPPGAQPGAYGQPQQYAYDEQYAAEGQYAADGQQQHGYGAYNGPGTMNQTRPEHPYGAAGVSYGMAQ